MINDVPEDQATSVLLRSWEKSISDLRALTDCAICSRPFYEPYIISCGHTFCFSCLEQYFSTGVPRRKTCPSCRQPVSQEPAPNFALRDVTHSLLSRPELLLHDETTEKHDHWASEEAILLQRARSSSNAERGLFGFSFGRSKAIRDTEDGVQRCPQCSWELERGECLQCGFHDSGTDSEHADWSSMSDGSDTNSRSVSPHGRGRQIEFIDLDPSEVSFESSSAASTVNAPAGRRRWRGYAVVDSEGDPVDNDDELGSLTGFVVDDEASFTRSSPVLRSGIRNLDAEPSSSSDDRSSVSSVHAVQRRAASRRRLLTTLDSDSDVTESSQRNRRHRRQPVRRGPRVVPGGLGPGLQRAQGRRLPESSSLTIDRSQGGATPIAPIEIDSSSGEEAYGLQSARGRATRARVVLSNDSNDDSDEEDSATTTQSRRRRPYMPRIIDTDDDDAEEAGSASLSTRTQLRHHLRGGGHSGSGDIMHPEHLLAGDTGSTSATVVASSPSRHVVGGQIQRHVEDTLRHPSYCESELTRPSVRSSSAPSPQSSTLSPSRRRCNTSSLRDSQPTSRHHQNNRNSHSSSSVSPTSTLQPSSALSSSAHSPSSSEDGATPAPIVLSPSPPASTAHHQGLSSLDSADQSVPDSSDRESSVDSHAIQTPQSFYAPPGSSNTFSLQNLQPARRNHGKDDSNDRHHTNLPDFRFQPDSRSNRRANASPARGDRSRLQARKQERRRAKNTRRRQRLQDGEAGSFAGSRLESIAA